MGAGLKLLVRDWKGGELGLLLASIILATATITCIQVFSKRLEHSLVAGATEFLASDVTIKSTQPINSDLTQKAKQLGISTATSVGFRAMLFTENDSMQISQVKGVDNQYPLKGSLTIFDGESQKDVSSGPQPGQVWLAPRLFDSLDVALGERIFIGEKPLTVSAKLLREPDNAQSLFGIAPRAMINAQDISQTGAVQLGSRINYALMLAANEGAIKTFKNAFDNLNNPHYRWQDIHTANRSLGSALSRAEQFLMLAASLGVMLCGLAIALATRRYATRQISHVAMLKTFGLTPTRISHLYVVNLVVIGLIAVIPGVVIGWLLHFLIIATLAGLFSSELADAGAAPFIYGAASGFLIFLSFSLAPVLKLKNVSPAAALRLDEHNNMAFGVGTWASGFIATLVLIYLYSLNLTLCLILLSVLAVSALGVFVCTQALVATHFVYQKFTSQNTSFIPTGLRLGLASIFRHRKINSLQIFIFSVLLLLLFTLTLVRTQLIDNWKDQAPEGTPNHFLFNIFDEQKLSLDALLESNNIEHSPFYPMTRGRLNQVNETSVDTLIEGKETRGDYERELNLTWSPTLGEDNKILNGFWWNETHRENPQVLYVSAEQTYAKGLNIAVGDKLNFSVSGETVIAEVASIRSVQWDSMNPNFYMIFNQPLLGGTSSSWLTSFYLPPENSNLVTDILRQYPTLSVIELDQVLNQVQTIISQVTKAVELLLILVLLAGFLVLIANIQASLDIRKQESAIIKTIGGDKKLVGTILLTEFVGLGIISGVLASIGSQIALFFLQTRFMQITFEPAHLLWVLGPIIGAVLIGFVGWASTRVLINTPPIQIIRSIN